MKKCRVLFVSVAVFTSACLHAYTGAHELPPASAAPAAADVDWEQFQQMLRARPPQDGAADREAMTRWMNAHNVRLRNAGVSFYHAYPHEPRRWDVVAILMTRMPPHMTGGGDWSQQLEAMIAALESSQDASARTREQVAVFKFRRHMQQAGDLADPQQRSRLQRRLDELAERFPQGDAQVREQRAYLDMLERHYPQGYESRLQALTESPNIFVSHLAKGLMALFKARSEPVDMVFHTLDGRRISLADLRGKVVLVEFWATWCKPCVAEIPNIKRLYESYGEQGLEVISVSLDDEKNRGKVMTCIEEQGMNWPQHFDGSGWGSPLRQRFAIDGIPFMLLLDREGKLADSHARGEVLERLVAKLLDKTV